MLVGAPAAGAGSGMAIGADEDAGKQATPSTAKMKMDLAKLAGLGAIRITQVWVKGQTALSTADTMALQNAANAASLDGVKLIVAIFNYKSSNTPLTDTDRAQFAQYAQEVVQTVPSVTDFVVGNEPNNNLFWQPQFNSDGSDAAAPAFEHLLARAYDAIKSVRPSSRVFGAGLAARGGDNPSASKPTHSPVTFIRDLGAAYRSSGRTAPIMDAFDQHVYEDNSSVPPSFDHLASNTISVPDYPKLVTALGQAFDGTGQAGSTLPILYGEFGVETSIPQAKASLYSGTEPSTTHPVDETTQGAYYVQAVKVASCQANVVGLMLFHVSDEADLSGWQSGVDYADDSAKTSLPAVRDGIAAANGGTLTTCPDSTAPTAHIDAPADGATVSGAVTLSATASDDVGVNRVEFLVDGTVAGFVAVPPYTFTWSSGASGTHTLAARALDAVRNSATSSVTVAVSNAASITSFSPASGPVGSAVTITGSNLTGATAVAFNGTNASSFTVDSATQITATVPVGATSGPIAVATPSGPATSSASFTVVPAPAIGSFTPASGGVGTAVTITGTGLAGATGVAFNGAPAATYTVQSDTQITASVPTGATTGSISVTTPGGTATSGAGFTVVAAPAIGSFSPSSGKPGKSVTISGTNFGGATKVAFNGTAATFTLKSATQLVATVPRGAATGPISVTTPGGTATSSSQFIVR
jgi:hypothetical protein